MTNKILLNKQQRRAVDHKSGPLLIVAGAGTGKTTVIVERVKHLIGQKKFDPGQILALTFTDKAAQEMLQRLDVVMPLGYEVPWLSTFHAFCDRVLKAEGLEIGLDPGYKILSKAEQWILIKKHLFDFKLQYYRPLGNPTKFIGALLTFFSRICDEDVSETDLLAYARRLEKKAASEEEKEEAKRFFEVVEAFVTYQELKIQKSVLDFGDLIVKTLELFRTRSLILKKYKEQFKHILVDEFQDTNISQYELIKLLAPENENPNLVVVGDDDQSVYKFRGASVSNILQFKNDYPKSSEIVLVQNYRSTQVILDSAYKVVQHNNPDRLESKLKINKKLVSDNKGKQKEKPKILQFVSCEAEVGWVCKTIFSLIAEKKYSFKDFAVVARANSQLKPFLAAFKSHGIFYQLVGNRGLFDQEEVRQLVCFLQVVVDPENSTYLFGLLQSRVFGISALDIFKLVQKAKTKRVSLWEVLQDLSDEKCQYVVKVIKSAQEKSLQDSITNVLHKFIKDTGYLHELIRVETEAAELKIKNLNLFLRLVQRFESGSDAMTVVDFVEHLDLLMEAGENPAQAEIEDIDTVSLTTVHSAKGLEFPVVFMPSLVVGRFPAVNRRDPIEFPAELIKETLPEGNENIQEERRLFYVGLTRARDRLYLTWAKDYGGLRQRYPSGFLMETKLRQTEMEDTPQLVLFDELDNKASYNVKVEQGKTNLAYVSYSQIDTFKTCPLKYKYRYVLQVPAAPHHALSFGQSIHDTLKDFHKFEQKGQRSGLKDLLYLYKQYFREEGYDSEAHKKKRFLSGKKSLKKYFRVYKKQFGQPVELEKGFRLTINGVPLFGKIDRIDKKGGDFEIIDYKTGQSRDKKQVDKDEQLSIYALGARHALNISVKKLSLYFLESNEKVSTTRSEKELKDTFSRIKRRVQEMKTSKFEAKPGFPFPCSYCEYSQICPVAAKKK